MLLTHEVPRIAERRYVVLDLRMHAAPRYRLHMRRTQQGSPRWRTSGTSASHSCSFAASCCIVREHTDLDGPYIQSHSGFGVTPAGVTREGVR